VILRTRLRRQSVDVLACEVNQLASNCQNLTNQLANLNDEKTLKQQFSGFLQVADIAAVKKERKIFKTRLARVRQR